MAHAKKKIIAVVAGMAVFAAVSASAATLGGITVDSVGAESGTVSQPADGVKVSWTVDYVEGKGYIVDGATLTEENGTLMSNDAEVRITVLGEYADGTDKVLGELTGTPGSLTITSADDILVSDVLGVDVVVNG